MSRAELNKIGIYIVIALSIIVLVIKPLNAKLEYNKRQLHRLERAYTLKYRIYEERLMESKKPALAPKTLSLLYSNNLTSNQIRNTVTQWLMDNAEKKGITVVNFEFPELKKGKQITEISVLIRFRGKIKPFLDYLEMVETSKKLILIRNLEISQSGQEFYMNVTFSFFRRES